ncbi:DP-EP family protein [Burkholderiaceae bacterium DAT-1]|nr:DP-EP family protein [Burkholderiaceae bacterium DAT-1]
MSNNFVVIVTITASDSTSPVYSWSYSGNGIGADGLVKLSGAGEVTYQLDAASQAAGFTLVYANMVAGPHGNITSEVSNVSIDVANGSVTITDLCTDDRTFGFTLVAKYAHSATPNAPIESDPPVINRPRPPQ